MIETLRENRAVLATGLAFTAAGAGAAMNVDEAAAWQFKSRAVAETFCPVGATEQTTTPISLEFNNTDNAGMVIDATYAGKDVDFQVRDENGELSPAQETLQVAAGKTAVAQLVGSAYVPGKTVDLTLRWNWKKSTSTDKSSVPVQLVPGAPCEVTPVTPTTPQPTTPEVVTPVTPETTTPVVVKTPTKKLKNNPAKLEVTKNDITDRLYTKNGQVVMRYGKQVGRVAPGEEFVTRVSVVSKDDGDKIKRERQTVKQVVTMPRAENGTPYQLAFNPKTGNWVTKLSRTVTVVEGAKAKNWNIRTVSTEAAANPPRIICNRVDLWNRGNVVDRDIACVYDPFDRR